MAISTATAEWSGAFKTGRGVMRPTHGAEVAFTTATRFEGSEGSNPEELIGAALAGCFSMALAVGLERAGITPQNIRTSAKVHLEKQDSGFGIPDDMQARLFQPFFRARSPETRNIEGTGLGLHLVKNIIERHNGVLRFHSVYGQGSTFGFQLPIVPDAPPTIPTEADHEPAGETQPQPD